MNGESKYLPLALPPGSPRREQQGFLRLCQALAEDSSGGDGVQDHHVWLKSAGLGDLYDQPTLSAAAHTAIDLVHQGWSVTVNRYGAVFEPPSAHHDRAREKERIRRQELLRRDEQLRRPSVRRFVAEMEAPRQHGSRLVSIFSLMRDGRELANALDAGADGRQAISPYVQVVDDSACELTGIRLHDIWRYFRHTWSNAYSTVPGRSMPILIRDAATEFHAVIGLAAISSPVVQIAQRDMWMGWETDQVLREIRERPTPKIAGWLLKRVVQQVREIYVEDLLRDGVLRPADLESPSASTIAALRTDADRNRRMHHQAATIRDVRNAGRGPWVKRAETHLFRSKRSAALAEALEMVGRLGGHLSSTPGVRGLRAALEDPNARAQIRRVIRRARGERVGTVIADLTVCGAVAPYSALAAGKLVGALAVSPKVLAAYRTKYSRPSEIASAMAGRPVVREARLSFIGTTSLYATGSSQYNRLFWPAEVMGGPVGERIGFDEIGRSRSFGTSHFSDETVEALVRLSLQNGSSVRVNSIFGEGVSPRLRKVRLGLDALGWPTNELLQHGRERILYGVPLVGNLRDYSLGIDREPRYLVDPELADGDEAVACWWFERWGKRRAAQSAVLENIRTHQLDRPVIHGARVPMPLEIGGPSQRDALF